jgi:hypothetical protein
MDGMRIMPFVDVGSAIGQARREGERIARELRALVGRSPEELQRDVRARADAALRELEIRSARVADVIERQVTSASRLVLGRFSAAMRGDVDALDRRVAALEKRLRKLERRHRALREPTA